MTDIKNDSNIYNLVGHDFEAFTDEEIKQLRLKIQDMPIADNYSFSILGKSKQELAVMMDEDPEGYIEMLKLLDEGEKMHESAIRLLKSSFIRAMVVASEMAARSKAH